jgi:SpoIIAA-like
MIEQLKDLPPNVVGFVCSGRVTRRDYETVLMPAVEAALRQHEKVRLYYQIALDFSHVEAGVSQDFKVDVEHLLRWDRIAIVTDLDWLREAIRVFSFLWPGAVEIFATGEAPRARAWVLAADAR